MAVADALTDTGPAEVDVAVEIRDLHIKYRYYSEKPRSLRTLVASGLRQRRSEVVHAVRGVDLTVRKGEVVGVVGTNGSGKSTLLQAIGGLLPPSSGSVLVNSQPVLLGVSSVLKPKLSGERNIVLGCLAMGLRMSEIREMVPEIVAFAGLEDAINRPMNTYSSGMKARLAFSIATIVSPDILLIDEALAVGDRRFKRRSLARIRKLQADAKTAFMVSHNMNEIRSTCTRAIYLKEGRVVGDGDVEDIVAWYERETDAD